MQNASSNDFAPASAQEPVVVIFREIEKVLTGQEAVGNITEAANKDPAATPAGTSDRDGGDGQRAQ